MQISGQSTVSVRNRELSSGYYYYYWPALAVSPTVRSSFSLDFMPCPTVRVVPHPHNLRTSALAVCYSVAEYCCPVWARSSYTNLIDTQLHSAMCLISDCLQPRQLPWLPVLSNVAPFSLRRNAATDSMLQTIEAHPNWPVYADVFEHPPPRVASRRPMWSDMTSVDTITQWREDWSSTSVVTHTTVTHPTILPPGFDLSRHTWSLMNRFRTCRASLHKWGLAQSPSCDCGQRRSMNHIVDTCPLTKFEGGLNLLHEAYDDAVIWLESTATAALAK